MNKKAEEVIIEQVVFIVLVVAFLVVMLIFITRAGSQSTTLEQEYSKVISLVIDKAKPGTNITLDLTELYDKARSNHFDERSILNIDNNNKLVVVRLVNGKGYSYKYFNNVSVLWNMKDDERRVYLEVKK